MQDPQPTTQQPANPGEGMYLKAIVAANVISPGYCNNLPEYPKVNHAGHSPMPTHVSVREYQCFEETQNARGNPKQNWGHILTSLVE